MQLRNRLVRKQFFRNTKIAKLERIERLFFIGCCQLADLNDYIKNDPYELKMYLFPGPKDNDVTIKKIENMIDSLIKMELLIINNDKLKVVGHGELWGKRKYVFESKFGKLKEKVFERDSYTCQYCGDKNNLTADHIIPKSKGGLDELTNLVTACQGCNSSKKNKTPEEAGMKLMKDPREGDRNG